MTVGSGASKRQPSAAVAHTFAGYADNVREYFVLDRLPMVEGRSLELRNRVGATPGSRNAHGFRSDPFDERSQLNILFLGCGWVEGWGVPRENSFPELVRSAVGSRLGCSISIWNVGLAEAGLDYAVRLVPILCRCLQPDLAVLIVPSAGRAEHFSDNGNRHMLGSDVMPVGGASTDDRDDAGIKIDVAWNSLQNEYQQAASVMQDLAALEGMFGAADIPWICSWVDQDGLHRAMESIQRSNLLPENRYLGHAFERLDGAQGQHEYPGPRSHELLAQRLSEKILQMDLRKNVRQAAGSGVKNWISRVWRRIASPRRRASPDREEETDIYPFW